MIINLGKVFRLCTDPYCFWIERLTLIKGATTGKVYERWARCTGYYNTWDGLFSSFIDMAIRGSEAQTAKALIKDINKAKKEALDAFKELKLPDEKNILRR